MRRDRRITGPAAAVLVGAGLCAAPAAMANEDTEELAACLGAAPDAAAAAACIGRISEPCVARPEAATTVGIAACLAREHAAWDALLNAFWPPLIAEAREVDEANSPTPEGVERAAPSLRAAQRAWLAFRDAECAHAAARSGGGSIRVIEAAECLRTLTARRVIDFHERLNRSR